MTTNSDACISDETPSDTGLSADLFFRLKSRSSAFLLGRLPTAGWVDVGYTHSLPDLIQSTCSSIYSPQMAP